MSHRTKHINSSRKRDIILLTNDCLYNLNGIEGLCEIRVNYTETAVKRTVGCRTYIFIVADEGVSFVELEDDRQRSGAHLAQSNPLQSITQPLPRLTEVCVWRRHETDRLAWINQSIKFIISVAHCRLDFTIKKTVESQFSNIANNPPFTLSCRQISATEILLATYQSKHAKRGWRLQWLVGRYKCWPTIQRQMSPTFFLWCRRQINTCR